MTARKKISNTATPAEASPAELAPVELDPIPEDPADVIYRRIADFQDSLPDRTYWWRKGDPAPDWMGPRPVWAEDHWQSDDRFLPNTCFWQSVDVEMPAQFMYGTTSQDRDRRTMGAYRAYLRQGMNDRDPHIGVGLGPDWKRLNSEGSQQFHLRLTLAETRQLIEALHLLIDIAENGAGAQ